MTLAIKNLSQRPRPRLNFRAVTERVLGRDYDLSLVFVDSARSQNLNRLWRNKNRPANVLSFPLASTVGEIFIDLNCALAEAKQNQQRLTDYLLGLFIHGLLHLKGLDHGSKMEALESQLVKYFQTYEQNDRHRSGCRQRLCSRGCLRLS